MIFDAIWRAEWNRNKVARSYDKGIKDCRKKKDYKGAEEWQQEAASVVGDLDTNLSIMTSRALVREAHKLHVPVPEYTDEESWENFWGSYVLTSKGYAALRTQVRQEYKDRRERWISWVKDVCIPIGGILISLASLMLAYHAVSSKTNDQAKSPVTATSSDRTPCATSVETIPPKPTPQPQLSVKEPTDKEQRKPEPKTH